VYYRTKHRAGIANLTSSRRCVSAYFCIIATVLILTGCSQSTKDYKKLADEETYQAIDSTWKQTGIEKVDYDIDAYKSDLSVSIEDQLPPSGVLTLTDAVAFAIEHNRQYQTQKENLYVKALDLTLIRHAYHPNPFARTRLGFEKDNTRDIEGFSREATYGFSQLLETGTQISTSVAFAWVDILSGDFRSGFTTLLSATVKKPFLRGSSRNIVLENLTQAQRDTLYQIRTFSRFRKEFVVSIIAKYYRVLQQHDLAENARLNYDTLNRTYVQMEKFVSNGRLPKYELEQAHQDRLQAWDISIEQEKLYQQMLDDFKIAMSIAPTDNFKLDLNELDILANKTLSSPSFSADQAIQTAMTSRLDLMNTADAIKDAERKIIVAKDLLRAELNLVVAGQTKTGLSSVKTKDSAIDLGLELDLPVDRKAERNQYRKALIVLDRQKRNHAQAADNIKHAIRQTHRDLTNAAEIYRLQQESLKLADERFKSTSLLIQYNRANTRDVLDAQKDFFNAKNIATAALVDYTVAMLDFYRDAGVLQVKPDGMWQTHKMVDKLALTNDNLTSLTKKKQTNPSEDAIKSWMKSQTAR
ncbi:MAG: TolC family protein, partial [Planctomycetes bacterium]|nr:TolC family protein [Planctomycetota bacterium]